MKYPETWQDFIARKELQFGKELQENKSVNMKDIGRKGSHQFLRVKWTFMVQHNLPQKVFIIERMERVGAKGRLSYTKHGHAEIEYRIGYFIVGRNGKLKNRWAWGQFCPLIPAKDLSKLLHKARKEKTFV